MDSASFIINRTPIEMLGYQNYSETKFYLFVEVLQCEEDIPDNECDCGLWESVGKAACTRKNNASDREAISKSCLSVPPPASMRSLTELNDCSGNTRTTEDS